MRNADAKLPDGYIRLNYIEASGGSAGAYFDTKIKSTNNTGVDITFQIPNGFTRTAYLLGSYTSVARFAPLFYDAENNNGKFSYTTTLSFAANTYADVDGLIHNVVFNIDASRSVVWDGDVKGEVETIAQGTGLNIFVFARNIGAQYGSNRSEGRVFNCKFYENGVLISSMIPAQRKADNVVGMYDTIRKEFFTSAVSAQFIGG